MAVCDVCFRHCNIAEGGFGFCEARTCTDGVITAANYGRITSLALDPIEKKPFARFYPGSMILSVGSYGCNLRCPFCQNYQISWSEEAVKLKDRSEYLAPNELAHIAKEQEIYGNIGVAFTYNEPLIGYEYIRDAGKIVHDMGMLNVLVTNGTAELSVLHEIAPYVDAMNIDIKGFTNKYYKDILGGDLEMVKDFISEAVKHCHVELTTLIVPGENDKEEEMREMTSWIASLCDKNGSVIGEEIPLHISRFFPRFHMTDSNPTDVKLIYRLAHIAEEKLRFVYTGNC